jgi:hypothetical protein
LTNPGKRITPYDTASLFAEAYGKSATIPNAVSGFASTGIFLFNSNIFSEADYAPSTVTDNAHEFEQPTTMNATENSVPVQPSLPGPSTHEDQGINQPAIISSPAIAVSAISELPCADETTCYAVKATFESEISDSIILNLDVEDPSIVSNTDVHTNVSLPSTVCVPALPMPPSTPSCSSGNAVQCRKRISVQQISPLPRVQSANKQGRKRTAQASEIITSSPFKQLAESNRKQPVANKEGRRKKSKNETTEAKKMNETGHDVKTRSRQALKLKKKPGAKKVVSQSTEVETACLVCGA